MDIHPPGGPTRSVKEFMIHILIVTIGILIALGLDGVRETVHNHRLVRGTIALMRGELLYDQGQLKVQQTILGESLAKIDAALARFDDPKQEFAPAQIVKGIGDIKPATQFLTFMSWDAALSSGALAHMTIEQVHAYAGVAYLTKDYSEHEDKELSQWVDIQSYSQAHATPNPSQIDQLREKLQVLRWDLTDLIHLTNQEYSPAIEEALKQPGEE